MICHHFLMSQPYCGPPYPTLLCPCTPVSFLVLLVRLFSLFHGLYCRGYQLLRLLSMSTKHGNAESVYFDRVFRLNACPLSLACSSSGALCDICSDKTIQEQDSNLCYTLVLLEHACTVVLSFQKRRVIHKPASAALETVVPSSVCSLQHTHKYGRLARMPVYGFVAASVAVTQSCLGHTVCC